MVRRSCPRSSRSQRDVLKLGDFGPCRSRLLKAAGTPSTSPPGTGSLSASSPDGCYGFKMDLWSAGCVPTRWPGTLGPGGAASGFPPGPLHPLLCPWNSPSGVLAALEPDKKRPERSLLAQRGGRNTVSYFSPTGRWASGGRAPPCGLISRTVKPAEGNGARACFLALCGACHGEWGPCPLACPRSSVIPMGAQAPG